MLAPSGKVVSEGIGLICCGETVEALTDGDLIDTGGTGFTSCIVPRVVLINETGVLVLLVMAGTGFGSFGAAVSFFVVDVLSF